jgi:RNA recognition motif-containing protein
LLDRKSTTQLKQVKEEKIMVLFVANFPKETEEFELEQLFSKFGTVHDVKICLKGAGQSAGYGFVEMLSEYEAERAIEVLNGGWWRGRRLKVNQKYARLNDDDDDDDVGRTYSWKLRKN